MLRTYASICSACLGVSALTCALNIFIILPRISLAIILGEYFLPYFMLKEAFETMNML